MRPYTLSTPAKRAQRAYTGARIIRAFLFAVGVIGFYAMLASIAFNLPLAVFIPACIAFGAGIMVAVYMGLYTVPRLNDAAFNARWECPSYVAYMAQFKAGE